MTTHSPQSSWGMVLEETATIASLNKAHCVALKNLVLTKDVTESTLEVHGELTCDAGKVVDSTFRISGPATFGEVCTTAEQACEINLFVAPAPLVDLINRGEEALKQKQSVQVKNQVILDDLQQPGRDLSHQDREKLMRVQFEQPSLEEEIKQLGSKLQQLEKAIEQRRHQTAEFHRGLPAGVLIRIGETEQRYLVTTPIDGPFNIEYVGDHTAVLMFEGQPVVPLPQHQSIRRVA